MPEGSRTLSRGLSILRALATTRDGATVAQMSTMTGLDRAVLYRLLDTLCDQGFVVRDDITRAFRLGLAMVELGARAGRDLEVTKVAMGGMQQLMELSREAVCLAVRDRDEVVVVERLEPSGLFVRIGYAVGFRHSLRIGAHGRVLLAALPEEEGLPAMDDADRAEVRRLGYASSTDELETGASGVAAAIRGADGRPVAAVGIVAPTARMSDPGMLGPRVAATAREISRRLGHAR